MAFTAMVIQVMIASPSDVQDERQVILEVIADWNSVHSRSTGKILLPTSWESHSSPEMGDHPQSIINRQVLKDCDLLIAAFWMRIGTPTNKAVSGTAEEIEEHLSANKPAMLYFSSRALEQSMLDDSQWQELKKFKKSCQDRGLLGSYSTTGDFRQKLTQHLARTMISNVYVNALEVPDT